MAHAAKTYRINLIRNLREKERKAEKRRRLQAFAGIACFAVLACAVLYSAFTIWKMERVLGLEEDKLALVRNEFKKYSASRTTVDKADVELLNRLQGRGIFWTRKLAALASHLPDNFTITGFSYRDGELRVSGSGLASSRQDQLLILDAYLNRLRKDTAFSDVFRKIYLNTASRAGDQETGRFGFEFSALTNEGTKKK